MQSRPVSQGKLVGAHRQTSPLLEAVDAPLDGVALLVCLSIETRRTASRTASPQAVTDLVRGLRDDRPDPASAKMAADRPRGVRTIREDGIWSGPGSPGSASRHSDPGHDSLEGRCITGLARRDVNG